MHMYTKYYDAHVCELCHAIGRDITGDNTQYVIRMAYVGILTWISVCMRPAHLNCLAAIWLITLKISESVCCLSLRLLACAPHVLDKVIKS